jgi:aminoglycoside phosphotransferase (APT) family kinase protein
LSDVGFWTQYLAEVLARHGLPQAPVEPTTPGTFPTLVAGNNVVKFFGERFSGGECWEVEHGLHHVLLAHPEIPAPAVVAEGCLFEDEWPWPYLVTTRVRGTPWSTAHLTKGVQARLAGDLGNIIRQVHALPPPTGQLWERDWLAELRTNVLVRHRQWGTLPAHLVEQIEPYLVEALPVRRLLHAALHSDHVFVDDGHLVAIIDWGDALAADPCYELPALHLHAFGGDKRLLAAFLKSYGWEIGPDFARRAMTMTLLHKFNVLRGVRATVDRHDIRTLDELVSLLWDIP